MGGNFRELELIKIGHACERLFPLPSIYNAAVHDTNRQTLPPAMNRPFLMISMQELGQHKLSEKSRRWRDGSGKAFLALTFGNAKESIFEFAH